MSRVTPRPTLSDQDYLALRDTAKQKGLYCMVPDSGTPACTRNGVLWTPSVNNSVLGITVNVTSNAGDVGPITSPFRDRFVAYFEFASSRAGNLVSWNANVWECEQDRSVVLVVRKGGLRIEGGTKNNGAFLIPEGKFTEAGGAQTNGTIIAKEFENQGNARFTNSTCWVENMPGPFLDVLPFSWSEIDR